MGAGGGLSESRPLSVGAVGSFLSHPAASLLSNKHANNEAQNSNNIIQQTNNKTSKDIISQSRPLPMWAPSNRTGQPPYPKSQSPSGSPDSTPSHPETPYYIAVPVFHVKSRKKYPNTMHMGHFPHPQTKFGL